eukprot:1136700-Pelagomonas_calceolata.AAC.2
MRQLRPGVAIAGADVVTGCAGEGEKEKKGEGWLQPLLRLGTVDATVSDAVGAFAAGTAATAGVFVGGGAENAAAAAAAAGGGVCGVGLVAAAATDGGGGLQSSCLSCCPSRPALRCRKGSPGWGRRPAGKFWRKG